MQQHDDQIRAAAIAYVQERARAAGGVVSRADLEAFTFRGQRLPLIERQRGIRKVAGLDAALTILTAYAPDPERRPYDDGVGPDGYLRYRWRGTDPEAFDNRALRAAMVEGRPLIWLWGVAPATFHPIAPVFLVAEEPEHHRFVVAIDEESRRQWELLEQASPHPADLAIRRIYVEERTLRRVHQPVFRLRVLSAYGRRCALCRLRHPELLEAAHIRPDAEGGEPVVPNGIAMCAIHHRAFDAHVVGIRPDHRVEIRGDVLAERDGPTLRHALQGIHGAVIELPKRPRDHPDPELLEERYERFRAAG